MIREVQGDRFTFVLNTNKMVKILIMLLVSTREEQITSLLKHGGIKKVNNNEFENQRNTNTRNITPIPTGAVPPAGPAVRDDRILLEKSDAENEVAGDSHLKCDLTKRVEEEKRYKENEVVHEKHSENSRVHKSIKYFTTPGRPNVR